MTLTLVREDPDRLLALVDILCAAASADAYVAQQEIVVVKQRLEAMLEVAEIPDAARDRMLTFDRHQFDLGYTLEVLALDDDADGQALLEAALAVVVADRFVDSSEYGFVAELAEALGLPIPQQLR